MMGLLLADLNRQIWLVFTIEIIIGQNIVGGGIGQGYLRVPIFDFMAHLIAFQGIEIIVHARYEFRQFIAEVDFRFGNRMNCWIV